ncbi:phage/plasmid replication protein gene II/Xfamily [Pseudomonas sp. MT-1]|nr:phage/plasmid replication protein gene II/Xfamily [Pseudomonas sp. MT-1]
MLKWLAGSYPKLHALLDWQNAEVYCIDCTYSVRLPDSRTALQLLQALRGVSNGQTRNRGDDYQTTAYWGSKESRLRRLKAYLKGPEFRLQLDEAIKAARSYSGANFVPVENGYFDHTKPDRMTNDMRDSAIAGVTGRDGAAGTYGGAGVSTPAIQSRPSSDFVVVGSGNPGHLW